MRITLLVCLVHAVYTVNSSLRRADLLQLSRGIGYLMEDVKEILHEVKRHQSHAAENEPSKTVKNDLSETEQTYPETCNEARRLNPHSGLVTLNLPVLENGAMKKITAYCEHNNSTPDESWLVLMRRIDGKYKFKARLWNDYKKGFGNPYGSFWIGLEIMHQLTYYNEPMMLKTEIETWEGETVYALCKSFSISAETDSYRLHISECTTSPGFPVLFEDGVRFFTPDRDHHSLFNSCGKIGGWWSSTCLKCTLTGEYGRHHNPFSFLWSFSCALPFFSYKKTEMKISPRTIVGD